MAKQKQVPRVLANFVHPGRDLKFRIVISKRWPGQSTTAVRYVLEENMGADEMGQDTWKSVQVSPSDRQEAEECSWEQVLLKELGDLLVHHEKEQ